jgi:uncharacterized protein DUF488
MLESFPVYARHTGTVDQNQTRIRAGRAVGGSPFPGRSRLAARHAQGRDTGRGVGQGGRPSDELRKWFGHDPERWTQFRRRYLRELDQRKDVLAPLVQAAREGDITLVYSARDEQHNQAVVIKGVLEEVLKSAAV